MKRKEIARYAVSDLKEIYDFIFQDNPDAADRYYDAALTAFEDLQDFVIPVRASQNLPENVRKLGIKGFTGYTLHILIEDDVVYLLAAFRPGLSEAQQMARTGTSLKNI